MLARAAASVRMRDRMLRVDVMLNRLIPLDPNDPNNKGERTHARHMILRRLNRGSTLSVPWAKKEKKHVVKHPRKASPVPARRVDLDRIVRLWRRTGRLPAQQGYDLSVDAIRSLDTTGVPVKNLKRMIRAMLSSSNSDLLNPGPLGDDGFEVCPNNGKRILGEKHKARDGHVQILCPRCSKSLKDIFQRGEEFTGRHPDDTPSPMDFHPSPVEAPYMVPHVPTPVSDFLVCEPSTSSATPPSSFRPVALHALCDALAKTVPVYVDSSTDPKIFQDRTCSPTPPLGSDEGNDIACALDGHHLTDEEVNEAAHYLDHLVSTCDSIVQKVRVTKYSDEHRIAVNRNVSEIKKPLVVVDVTYSYRDCNVRSSLLAAAVCLIVVVLLYHWSLRPVFLLLAPTFLVTTAVFIFLSFVYAAASDRTFSYVPHLLSCIVMEYERGTNASVAISTLRQKARRLACLPISDREHLSLVLGTEVAAIATLNCSDFVLGEASRLTHH
jgi:hypothetical protein